MAIDTTKLLQEPTKKEIARMTFEEMQARKAFAYQVAVANRTNAERLLSELYTDPTHFIFELLQNAEDTGATEVKITLESERLIFTHNGRHFDNKDTWAILSIDDSTKSDDITQIGCFGIGFKSVFGICDAPEIYSCDFCFRIRNFYVPEKITRPADQDQTRTHIILPFKKAEAESIYETIEAALLELNPDTFLFLRNIEKVDFATPENSGFFEKKKHKKKSGGYDYYEVDILGRKGLEAKYLLFEKALKRNKKLFACLAFEINEDKTMIVAETDSTKLGVFFPTETDTFLHFKMNAPYQTTPTRASVPTTPDNIEIPNETAELYAYSLRCIQSLKLLTVEFLSTLPLKSRKVSQHRWVSGAMETTYKIDNIWYETMHDATVKAFTEEALLPTLDNKGFTAADKAILARGGATDTRGETIVDLLSAEDIASVFDDRTTWLTTDITQNKTPELRTFLISVLKIKEVDFNDFLTAIKGAFLETKDVEWLTRFYTIAIRNIDGIKRNHLGREIIKTESGRMVAAQVNKRPNVYLASKLTTDTEKIVHRELSRNDEVLSFFRDIGIEEMGVVESIRTQWLPSITSSKTEDENCDGLELLYLEYCDQKPTIQTELCDLLSASDCILYGVHNEETGEDEAHYGKPTDFFMAHGASKILYDECPRVRFINDTLNAKAEKDKGFFSFLKAIGVRVGARFVQLSSKLDWHDAEKQRILKNARINWDTYSERAYEIYEIDYILENINKERSRALWNTLNNMPEERFKGYIKWRYRNTPYEEPFTAYFVRTLQEAAWLYIDDSDEPVTPRDAYQDEAEKVYGRAPLIAKHIVFKADAERQLDPELYEKLALAKKIPIAELQRLAEAYAAIPEIPRVIDIIPEDAPVSIQTAEFSNSRENLTAEELTQDEEAEGAAGAITDVLEELYGNADIPETVKERITIKHATNEAEIDGDLGERFVLSSLKEEYRQDGYAINNEETNGFSATRDDKTFDIIRHNTAARNQRGYDITIAERGVVSAYIEVKAKKDDNPKLFKISGLQWEFARKLYDEGNGEKHWVYVVTYVRDPEKTAITKLNNPYGEVEFVKNADIEKRVAEVEAQYGGKTHGFGGLFTPEAKGHSPLIIVGYDESDPLGYIEIYCHELQHAIDYYEIMQSSDKEILESYRTYFHYYTEYNASYSGILRHTLVTLEVMPPQDRAQYIVDSKDHAKTVFAKWDKKDVVDVLYYLARFTVFTCIEGRQDDAMLVVVPQAKKFISIANLTNRYQPTLEWYAEFKKMIDELTVEK